jgi:hypothetical protein
MVCAQVNGEPQKRAEEILDEVAITLTLSGLRGTCESAGAAGPAAAAAAAAANSTSGFVETYGVGICQGAYAPSLCAEWHRWDSQHSSENEAVDVFGRDQLFVVGAALQAGAPPVHTCALQAGR